MAWHGRSLGHDPNINSEDRLVQQTFADHLRDRLGWDGIYAHQKETFGPQGTLGRTSERDVVLVRDLRAALARLKPDLPAAAREPAIERLTRIDFARSMIQHNREYHGFIRGGVPIDTFSSRTARKRLRPALRKSITCACACRISPLAKERLLEVENFILFDDSRPGGTRKIVARNHQVLGVNRAVASVLRQEELKRQFPPDERLIRYQVSEPKRHKVAEAPSSDSVYVGRLSGGVEDTDLPLVKRAHEDLGRLGVFWHTQGSGKSYSMAFFAEKVRRVVPGNFTFLVMTDREDLDDQIWRTFIGCGVADEQTPRASSGKELHGPPGVRPVQGAADGAERAGSCG